VETDQKRQSSKNKRVLIFRLSSLGDVVLASSVLNSTAFKYASVDWVVSNAFSSLLQGHPKIHRLWSFDRTQGFEGWRALCRELHEQGYDEIYDLHRTLRTRLARVFFYLWKNQAQWKVVSKERFQTFGYFFFKKAWPKSLRPLPWLRRFRELLGEREDRVGVPDLTHLLKEKNFFDEFQTHVREPYVCVMPSSHWAQKQWPVQNYLEFIRSQALFPVILGTLKDEASVLLVDSLKKENIPFFDGVGRWSLPEVSVVLSSAKAYFGSDTGLAHMAEALGTPAWVIFGPTAPDSGFGPWREQSQTLEQNLWCRPCGKTGRFCLRPVNRYQCLQGFEVRELEAQLSETLSKTFNKTLNKALKKKVKESSC
jgi:ADP-heptose:LPS heptosyltransferase